MIDFLSSYLRFNLHGMLNIIAGIINLSIGILVFCKNPRSSPHRAFFFVTLTSSIWVFGFGMMYQATPNTKGSGIGLAIAKAWVEAHGGKIWAESPCAEASGDRKGLPAEARHSAWRAKAGTKMVFTLPL